MIKNGAKIITDSLFLYLDGGNPKCFVSGAPSLYDLSGNKRDVSVFNTTVDSTTGSFIMNGSSSYFKLSQMNLGTNQFTLMFFAKYTGSGTYMICELSNNYASNVNSFDFVADASYITSTTMQTTFPEYNTVQTYGKYNSSRWINVCFTNDRSKDGDNQGKMYINGKLDNWQQILNYQNTQNYGTYDFYIGSRAGSQFFFPGNLGTFMVYNKALTFNELFQNYNNLKGRYGL